ncbi:MAG: hypothetical protein H6Q73_714 [Firmicutes bacterium]|nr:hypothetical protein [Bacillota bacterium]
MLVVISDLHFQDTINDVIKDEQGNILVDVQRNIFYEVFETTFEELRSLARLNNAQELIIVLAGDIFDFNRSRQWFNYDVRPYDEYSSDKWGPIAVKIFDDIVESNRQTFDCFNKLLEISSNDVKIDFRYIPGNHDRIVNLYEPLQKRVRALLGLNGEGCFEHEIVMEKYGVHIRHGHEYDPINFAGEIPRKGPFVVKNEEYDLAPLGDYVTIDFAARVAFEYRKRYEKDMKCGPDQDEYRLIYRKFLEFDDLRPLTAIKKFLESEMADKYMAWKFLLYFIFTMALPRALESEFVCKKLGMVKFYLLRVFAVISPQLLINYLMRNQSTGQDSWYLPQRSYIQREPILQNAQYQYLVSGHTHNPAIEYLRRRDDGKEEFFFDTGTWRRQISRCCDNSTFGRAKTLTYVAFYSSDEDLPRAGGNKGYSFDYWSGYNKREIAGEVF